MKYPTEIVDDYGQWGRIHRGHGLDQGDLEADLEFNQGRPFVPASLKLKEVHFRYIPRIKWCDLYGGCDQEGDWHGHWVEVKPSESTAFTVATWELADEAAASLGQKGNHQ